MTAILLVVAVSASFWAGYFRRRATYQAEAQRALCALLFTLDASGIVPRLGGFCERAPLVHPDQENERNPWALSSA